MLTLVYPYRYSCFLIKWGWARCTVHQHETWRRSSYVHEQTNRGCFVWFSKGLITSDMPTLPGGHHVVLHHLSKISFQILTALLLRYKHPCSHTLVTDASMQIVPARTYTNLIITGAEEKQQNIKVVQHHVKTFCTLNVKTTWYTTFLHTSRHIQTLPPSTEWTNHRNTWHSPQKTHYWSNPSTQTHRRYHAEPTERPSGRLRLGSELMVGGVWGVLRWSGAVGRAVVMENKTRNRDLVIDSLPAHPQEVTQATEEHKTAEWESTYIQLHLRSIHKLK